MLHPAAEACWESGPSFRVVFKQEHTNFELWQEDLTPQVALRTRILLQALISRTLPQYSPRSLLPPEVVILTGGRAMGSYRDVLEKIGALQIKDLPHLCSTLDDLRKPAKKTKR